MGREGSLRGGCQNIHEPAHNPRAHGRPPTVAPFRAWRGSAIPTSPEDSGPAPSPRTGGRHPLLSFYKGAVSHVLRRGWDLNPRYRSRYTRFPVVHLRPLGHLSILTGGR